MRGFLMSARAMAMRCFCPPDSWMPPSPSCAARMRARIRPPKAALCLLHHRSGKAWTRHCDRTALACVRKPAGAFLMKSIALAASAAWVTSSSVASSTPKAMLSRMVPCSMQATHCRVLMGMCRAV